MTQCDWCDKEMSRKNYARHQKTCVFRVEIGLKKSDVEKLKGQNVGDETDNSKIEIDNIELKQFLEEIYKKTIRLHKKILIEDDKNPIDKINDMMLGENTKLNYLREWKLYDKWLKKQKKPIGKVSAETYLASLKCRASTKRQKFNTLQLLLQHIVDPTIKLQKVRWRISFKPKYALSSKELNDYLNEQKKFGKEYYAIQKLMAIYGLRVNTCSSLKLKHLEYRYRDETDEDRRIHLPDSKTKIQRIEPIDKEMCKLLELHIRETINDLENEEEYVFFQQGKELTPRQRAFILAKTIHNRINKSKVIKKYPGYTYSSHMFRKTKAYNIYQSGVASLKAMVRNSIGQSEGSMAVESYIN